MKYELSRSLFSTLCLSALASALSAQPIQTAQALQKPQGVLTAPVTPNVAIKALATSPDLSFKEVQISLPQLQRTFKFAPNGTSSPPAVITMVESGELHNKDPNNTFLIDSCKTPLLAVLSASISNTGSAPFDSGNNPNLGLTGSIGTQAITRPVGQVSNGSQDKTLEIDKFMPTAGTYRVNLTLNKQRGGGEANFANNNFAGVFELRCISKESTLTLTKPLDIVKAPVKPVLPIPPEPPKSGAELNMIEIQSHVSKRATALQLNTQMMNSINESTKGVEKNIGR